jgi:hypothetical protein
MKVVEFFKLYKLALGPQVNMKVTFILQLFCIKDPMAYVYLQIGPYSYLRAYFPYNTINLTPNIIFLLGFKATFQSTHHTLKGLYIL